MDRPKPYEGRQPYIFVSYAHEDSARVWPIIARLQADGFRVWYDEGVAPGSEWANKIAQTLSHCGYFFAFLTGSYLDSDNCKDELHQSRENHIENRLLFYLDNVKLEDGMALRNSRLQAIHWYAYGADEIEDAYAKLYTAENLACCHKTGRLPRPKTGPAPVRPEEPPAHPPRQPAFPSERTAPRPSETARPFDLRKLLLPLGILLAVVAVGSIALSFLNRGGGFSDRRPASSEGERPAGGDVELTSIIEPVAQEGFRIQENVTNTLGTTYKNAVVVSDWHGAPYVRYYVGDYSVMKGNFSIPRDSVGEGSSFTLTVYLDENEDAPLPGYDRLELTRTSLEQPFEFDVSGASFITFQLRHKSNNAGIMLTDTYLYEDAASVPAQTGSTGQSPAKAETKLTSITEPVAQEGFRIQEDVTNTLGVTYKDAVVVSDWTGDPYVRYYVGDYSVMKGSFSIPGDSVGEGSSFTLTVYLDENEDAPLPGYDRLELTRTSLEQPFEFDVSGASFITFQLGHKSNDAGIMLTDTYLYEDAASVPAQTAGTGQSPAKAETKLTSITGPVAQLGFRIQEDVTNTLGTTYKDAVVVSDWHGDPYVRYYVGDYSVMKGSFSIPSDGVGEGSSFTLTVYLDENQDAPLPGYDRLELTRTSLEQPFEFDVSGASFITFQLEHKSNEAGIMLTDTYLYEDAASVPAQTGSTGQSPAKAETKLTSITEPVAQLGFRIQEDVTNTLGTTYKDAVVVSDWHGDPYVRYYVGDYSVMKGSFSIPSDGVGEGSSFTLTVYLDENQDAPLPGYDRLELTRTSLEQPFEFDVSGASFITFQLEHKSNEAGIMLTDCVLS